MIKKIKSKMSINKKNIAKISTGTLIGQVISFATLPIITRIYGPEVLGAWAMLNSLTLVIKSFSDLGLSNAMMTESEENVEGTYKVISTAVLLISLISALLIMIYLRASGTMTNINQVFIFISIVLLIFVTQQIQVCYTWLNRNKNYDALMKNPIIQQGSYGIIAIVLGLIGYKTYGYYIGQIIGMIITLIHMKRKLPKTMFTIDKKQFISVISRNKRFVAFQMPTNVLSNFKNQIPVLLIQYFWNLEIVGYYSITIKILQVPSTLLANAIGRVLFQITAELKRKGQDIGEYVYNNLIKAMKYGVIPMTLLMALGDIIVIAFLGEEWRVAGEFIRILAIQYYFMFLMNTVFNLAVILGKHHYAMISSVLQIFGFVLGALIGKICFDSVYAGLLLMSVLYILIHIGYFSSLFKVMNIPPKKYLFYAVLSISIIVISSLVVRSALEYFGAIEFIYSIIGI